jgi:hypothetical protein
MVAENFSDPGNWQKAEIAAVIDESCSNDCHRQFSTDVTLTDIAGLETIDSRRHLRKTDPILQRSD